jgi:hypothetical protein
VTIYQDDFGMFGKRSSCRQSAETRAKYYNFGHCHFDLDP